ncbi:methyltransferase domain-containing protein, partial [Nocardiopsis halotolerans]|uniref:hypothetical protein n=1 Tax=Nocardiopsis halotolerans TaxID=124252 RepID=UPI00036721C4
PPPRLPIDYRVAALEEMEPDPEGYGFVSAVSSIHHMPFGPSLERMTAALAPGGTLAVLGLYREARPSPSTTLSGRASRAVPPSSSPSTTLSGRASRAELFADAATSLAALGPQWAIGVGMGLGRLLTGTPNLHGTGPTAEMPVRDPEMSLREIVEETAEILPGARVRRLLFWRYSLVYTRPA